MTGMMPREVVAAVVDERSLTLRHELQRCRGTIDKLKRACQRSTLQLEGVSIFTQLAQQLLEFELRSSGTFVAAEALRTLLAQIDSQLTVAGARDLHEQLESLLIYSDDDGQLSGRLERERIYDDQLSSGSELVWSEQYPRSELELLCSAFATGSEHGSQIDDVLRSRARSRLRNLQKMRLACRRERNMDITVRSRMMLVTNVVMLGLLLLMTLLFQNVAWGSANEVISVVSAMTAGAVGATLSCCHKLREEALSRDAFRRYVYKEISGQAAAGQVAGLFVFVVVNSGLVSIAGLTAGGINWYQAATLGFLSGFSEPFFVGLVRRISPPQAPATKQTPSGPNAAANPRDTHTPEGRRSNVRIAAVS